MNAEHDAWGQAALLKVYRGQGLDQAEAERLVELILREELSPLISAALLALMSCRGERDGEVAGALRAVAAAMTALRVDDLLGPDARFFDVVGTGGDGKRCVNLSTATAVCLAAMGYPCAKHGNRAQSGLVGSADILELCGVPTQLQAQEARSFFQRHGFVYLFAPHFHPAFRYVAPIRRALRLPTIFNLLGPLSNPSRPNALAVGAPVAKKAKLLSAAAARVGRARVVCIASQDGYDEVSTAAPTEVFYRGELVYTIDPRKYFEPCPMPRVRDSEHALESFRAALAGEDQGLTRALAMNLALCLAWVVPAEWPAEQSYDEVFARAYREAHGFVVSGEGVKKLQSMRG